MEIKACPFCTASEDQLSLTHEGDIGWLITCHSCGVVVSMSDIHCDRDTLVRVWNRRIENDKRCKTCRHWINGIGGRKWCNRGYCKGSLTRVDFECGNWQPKEE